MTTSLTRAAACRSLATVAALVLISKAAHAQEAAGWSVALGAGAIYAPDYEGSDDLEVMPFPYVMIDYADRFYIHGPELGLNLVTFGLSDEARMHIGPLARYRRDRPERRNSDLSGLGSVDAAVEIGGAWRLQVGEAWLGATVAKDVAGGHDGVIATSEVGIARSLAPHLTGTVSATLSWANDDYVGSYFSITPDQALRSGLPAFDADSGIKDVGASIGLQYGLGRHWVLTAAGGYTRLLGDVADAPLVARRGSQDQWQVGLFLAYRL